MPATSAPVAGAAVAGAAAAFAGSLLLPQRLPLSCYSPHAGDPVVPEGKRICNCPYERNPQTGKYERVPRADCPVHMGS